MSCAAQQVKSRRRRGGPGRREERREKRERVRVKRQAAMVGESGNFKEEEEEEGQIGRKEGKDKRRSEAKRSEGAISTRLKIEAKVSAVQDGEVARASKL